MQLRISQLSLVLLQMSLLTGGIKAFFSPLSSNHHHPAQQQLPSGRRFSNHRQHIGTPLALAEETSNLMELELTAEPDGGKELSALKTMPACRMKEMAATKGDGFEFWMTAQAEGSLVKEIRSQILKDASKKANFPGFRKVRQSVIANHLCLHYNLQGTSSTVCTASDHGVCGSRISSENCASGDRGLRTGSVARERWQNGSS